MASPLWAGIYANTDLMGLLTLIKSSLFTGATRQKPTESLQEAKEALLTLKQGDTSNGDCLNKFQSLVEHVEHHGGEPDATVQELMPLLTCGQMTQQYQQRWK